MGTKSDNINMPVLLSKLEDVAQYKAGHAHGLLEVIAELIDEDLYKKSLPEISATAEKIFHCAVNQDDLETAYSAIHKHHYSSADSNSLVKIESTISKMDIVFEAALKEKNSEIAYKIIKSQKMLYNPRPRDQRDLHKENKVAKLEYMRGSGFDKLGKVLQVALETKNVRQACSCARDQFDWSQKGTTQAKDALEAITRTVELCIEEKEFGKAFELKYHQYSVYAQDNDHESQEQVFKDLLQLEEAALNTASPDLAIISNCVRYVKRKREFTSNSNGTPAASGTPTTDQPKVTG